jgi:glycosyltransferase involved in cell wall biosynthesis
VHMTPSISVVVPTYSRSDRLPSLIRALAAQTMDPDHFEVIVVDNGSDDDTPEVLASLTEDVPFALRTLRIEINRGPARARNLGWRSAAGPFIAFLDDDCHPAPAWLENGCLALRSDCALGVLQGATMAPFELRPEHFADHYVWRIVDRPTPYFDACNIFYRRQALEATGGFAEELGWWGEDTAAGWRVVEAGWRRGFASNAVVVHPVERRGWRWQMRTGLLDANIVRVAAEHPGFRAEAFWRPWCYRREDAAFMLAVLAALVGIRRRSAILVAAPYVWLRRPSVRHRSFLRLCLQIPLIDAARLAGQLRGSLWHQRRRL